MDVTELDFFATIQLVNYVRSQVRQGVTVVDFATASSGTPWTDEKYLQPVLEDDALLYSIDELADPDDAEDPLATAAEDEGTGGGAGAGAGSGQRVGAERDVR